MRLKVRLGEFGESLQTERVGVHVKFYGLVHAEELGFLDHAGDGEFAHFGDFLEVGEVNGSAARVVFGDFDSGAGGDGECDVSEEAVAGGEAGADALGGFVADGVLILPVFVPENLRLPVGDAETVADGVKGEAFHASEPDDFRLDRAALVGDGGASSF